ncbi:MAG: Lin1244/Lin1753 domain-containing protein [Planctomycetaceae bacterium]
MKWFKHDSDAHADAKLRRVRLKYGMQGYGLYWYCLELIARGVEKSRLTFELEHDAELISADTGIGRELVEEMMRFMTSAGLFEESGGIITCLKMASRTDDYTAKLITSRQNVPTLSGQCSESVGRKSALLEEKRLEEKRKKERSGDEYTASFLDFWKQWPGTDEKGSKAEAAKVWEKLKGRPDTNTLITLAKAQAAEKRAKRAHNEFASPFKHVCRWLQGREWENDSTLTNPCEAGLGEAAARGYR